MAIRTSFHALIALTLVLLLVQLGCMRTPVRRYPIFVKEVSLIERNGRWYILSADGRSNEPFTGRRNQKYDSGVLEWEKTYVDGILDGPAEVYYEDGQLKEKGSFKDGKKDGSWQYYWSSGQLDRTEKYRHGELVQ